MPSGWPVVQHPTPRVQPAEVEISDTQLFGDIYSLEQAVEPRGQCIRLRIRGRAMWLKREKDVRVDQKGESAGTGGCHANTLDDNPRQGRRTEPGTIQLQAHDAGTDIEFRDIRIGY